MTRRSIIATRMRDAPANVATQVDKVGAGSSLSWVVGWLRHTVEHSISGYCPTLVAIVLLCGVATPAAAYDFRVTSRTEAQGYQLRRYGVEGLALINRRRVTQYLGLTVYNLWPPASDDADRAEDRPLVWVNALMRFYSDFGDYVQPVQPIAELEDNRFELLLGTVEARRLAGCIDLSVGRQYDAELMDIFAYDGVRVQLRTPWRFYVEASSGVQVHRGRPFAASVFETDGTTADSAADAAWSPVFAAAAGIDDSEQIMLRLAYRGVASRARPVALPSEQQPARWGIDQELFFVHAAITLPITRTLVDGAMRYNLLVAGFDELSAAIRQPLGSWHELHLEVMQSRPHFDGDSIFNVFALEPFEELAGRYIVRPWDELEIDNRVSYRWFWGDRQLEPDQQTGAWTVENTTAWHHGPIRTMLSLFYFDGLGGQRLGGDLNGSWASPRWFFGRQIFLDGRFSLVRQRDDQQLRPVITTFGCQTGGRVRLLPDIWLHLTIEDNISRLYQSALRFMAVLDMVFAP